MTTKTEILQAFRDRGVKFPVRVWSAGFVDIFDGKEVGGIPDGHPSNEIYEAEKAIMIFFELSSGGTQPVDSENHRVVKPYRIIDAEGTQIFP